MICVYKNRQFGALGISVAIHAFLLLGVSHFASTVGWQPAVGNRGGDLAATEVALWERPGSVTARPKPAKAPQVSPLDVETGAKDAKAAEHNPPSTASMGAPAARGVGSGGTSTDYRAILHSLLDSSKTYPAALRDLHISGVVRVRFRVTRQGRLEELEVLEKESLGPLRAEAMKFLQRVDQVPMPPSELSDDELRFELPLRYEGRG
jgi:periplasmic protein TonB